MAENTSSVYTLWRTLRRLLSELSFPAIAENGEGVTVYFGDPDLAPNNVAATNERSAADSSRRTVAHSPPPPAVHSALHGHQRVCHRARRRHSRALSQHARREAGAAAESTRALRGRGRLLLRAAGAFAPPASHHAAPACLPRTAASGGLLRPVRNSCAVADARAVVRIVHQVIAVTSYILVKWAWSWLQSRKAKKEPPAE